MKNPFENSRCWRWLDGTISFVDSSEDWVDNKIAEGGYPPENNAKQKWPPSLTKK